MWGFELIVFSLFKIVLEIRSRYLDLVFIEIKVLGYTHEISFPIKPGPTNIWNSEAMALSSKIFT